MGLNGKMKERGRERRGAARPGVVSGSKMELSRLAEWMQI